MLLDVVLGGYETQWRFDGTIGLDRWLRAVPWVQDGGACVIRLSGSDDGDEVAEAVQRSVHGHDAGGTNVQVRLIYPDAIAEGVVAGVVDALGIASGLGEWDTLQLIAAELHRDANVFVALPPATQSARDLGQEANDLRDRLSKLERHAPFTVLLMANAHCPATTVLRSFDFRVGEPLHGVLEEARGGPGVLSLWPAYVHARLAWECGGDRRRAQMLADHVSGQIRPGDDETLEKLLNEWARAQLNAEPPERVRALWAIVGTLGGNGEPGTAEDLANHGLLWHPRGARTAWPLPWTARALAQARPEHPVAAYLRSAMVCLPLAAELMARCQEIEHQLRGVLLRDTDGNLSNPPPDAFANWTRCRQGQDEIVRYPASHPAPPVRPTDAWMFATLGQFLFDRSGPLKRQPSDMETRLVRLRNAVAHGHHLGWRHLVMMRDLIEWWERGGC